MIEFVDQAEDKVIDMRMREIKDESGNIDDGFFTEAKGHLRMYKANSRLATMRRQCNEFIATIRRQCNEFIQSKLRDQKGKLDEAMSVNKDLLAELAKLRTQMEELRDAPPAPPEPAAPALPAPALLRLIAHVHPRIMPVAMRHHRHKITINCKETRSKSSGPNKICAKDEPRHTNADGSTKGICYSNVMGICNNTGVFHDCGQGLHLPGDQLTEEQVYFVLRYYGREMIVFFEQAGEAGGRR